MPIGALALDKVLAMNEEQRMQYFFDFARFIEDVPKLKYAIRVGSKTLQSDDTHDLRVQFDQYLARMSRIAAK